MGISSTVTLSMASPERKRCSNIAFVRRLRSFAWMNARKLPGVRCSTLMTVCSSLLCLITIPGRILVAGIDMLERTPWFLTWLSCTRGMSEFACTGPDPVALAGLRLCLMLVQDGDRLYLY